MPSPNTFIVFSVQVYVAVSITVAWAALWGAIGFLFGYGQGPTRVLYVPEQEPHDYIATEKVVD
jgi:hypothetical protein